MAALSPILEAPTRGQGNRARGAQFAPQCAGGPASLCVSAVLTAISHWRDAGGAAAPPRNQFYFFDTVAGYCWHHAQGAQQQPRARLLQTRGYSCRIEPTAQ